MAAAMADRVSLSPNLISATARVSFSLTIGITPISRSSLIVLTALIYCERWDVVLVYIFVES